MARMGNLLTRREGTFCNPSGILIQARAQQWMLIPLGERYIPKYYPHSVQFSSVTQTCPTLCDPMNCSTPGLPVHHHLPEFTQTHVHQVSDDIQPSHPLLSPSRSAPVPPSIRVFSNESTLYMTWPKYWSFSFSISTPNE